MAKLLDIARTDTKDHLAAPAGKFFHCVIKDGDEWHDGKLVVNQQLSDDEWLVTVRVAHFATSGPNLTMRAKRSQIGDLTTGTRSLYRPSKSKKSFTTEFIKTEAMGNLCNNFLKPSDGNA